MSGKELLKLLPGAANIKARSLYKAIKKHCKVDYCDYCKFYEQYGVIIVYGDFDEHIEDINGSKVAASELFKLKDAGLIELGQVSPRQYSITIVEFQPQEVFA